MERSSSDGRKSKAALREHQQWQQERETLLKTIALLEQELRKEKALNSNLLKQKKHKRTSSEDPTFIFNQTNISSYYPIVLVKNQTWGHKFTLRSHLDSVRTLQFAGPHLITAGEDATLKVWHRDKLDLTLRQHLGSVYSIAVSEEFVFTAGSEGVLRKWKLRDLLKGQSAVFEEEISEEPIWSLAYNQKKGLLVTSNAEWTFTLLKNSLEGMETVWKAKVEGDSPTAVEWVSDNRFVAGLRDRERVGVFEVEEGDLGWEYSFEGKSSCRQANCLQVGDKLKMIAAGHEDHFIRFYDPNSSNCVAR